MEKLKKQMTDQGMNEAEADQLVSLYIPQRWARRFGRARLRMDKLRPLILLACLAVALIFIAAFLQEKTGSS